MRVAEKNRYGEAKLTSRRQFVALGPALATSILGRGLACGQVLGGAAGAPPQNTLLSPARYPFPIRSLAEVLGSRVAKAGKERVALTGVLSDARGDTPVALTGELPDKLRLAELAGQGRTLVFDGEQALKASKQVGGEENLLESLAIDTQEAFLYGVQAGAALRPIGGRFRDDDGRQPNYQGPYSDVFELVLTVRVRADRAQRQKFYWFDSETHLLRFVRYAQPGGVRVETAYSGWQQIDGQAVPGLVRRSENGRSIFSLRLTAAVFSPSVGDSLFAQV